MTLICDMFVAEDLRLRITTRGKNGPYVRGMERILHSTDQLYTMASRPKGLRPLFHVISTTDGSQRVGKVDKRSKKQESRDHAR